MNDSLTLAVPSILVIYHGNCADGFSAAWAAWRRFGRQAEYLPADHANRPQPALCGRAVYVLDFSYPREQAIAMAAQARSFQIIDHHETARQDLGDLPFCTFDNNRAGGLLAWNTFHPGQSVPRFLEHINDRDLGQWRLADSKPFLAWMERVPRSFANWDRLAALSERAFDQAVKRGRIIATEHARLAEQFARRAVPITIAGARGLAVACHESFASSVGTLLAERSETYGLTYSMLPDLRLRISLRSVEGFDAGALASNLGGGGHTRIAGCVLDAPHLLSLLQKAR